MYWYEMHGVCTAELAMPIDFGDRLFVSRLESDAVVDQRFTQLNCLPNVDVDLLLALLNSAIGLFYIEGLSFGRGLGALDLGSTRIKKAMRVLDPNRLDGNQALSVKSAFQPLQDRNIYSITEECKRSDRRVFDETVIEAYRLSVSGDHIYKSLTRLVNIRLTAGAV